MQANVEQKELSKQVPDVKKLVLGQWQVNLALQDHLLSIECRSLLQKYLLRKQITEVPQKWFSFCQNLSELVEFLHLSGSVTIVKQSLVVSCQVGKLAKKIGVELNREELSQRMLLINTQKLLQTEKQKVETLRNELQKQKQLRQKAEAHMRQYIKCAKNGCQNLLKLGQPAFQHRGKYVCSEKCKW